MWPRLVLQALTAFSKWLMLPAAAIVGAIGYTAESLISDKYTPSIPSVLEQRQKRMLEQTEKAGSLKDRNYIPKTVFEKNLSPSLREPDNQEL